MITYFDVFLYLKVMYDFIKDFAVNVKQQRIKFGMNQENLANASFVSVQTISSIENAKHFPSYKILVNISKALKLHPAQLLIGHSEFWNIEDKELQYVLVEAFKNLTPKQREIALKLVQTVSELDV